jgi:transposase
MAAYSVDLWTRVFDDWDAGLKAEEAATKYRVSRAWVHRLVQRRRETGGEIGPRPQTRSSARRTAARSGIR